MAAKNTKAGKVLSAEAKLVKQERKRVKKVDEMARREKAMRDLLLTQSLPRPPKKRTVKSVANIRRLNVPVNEQDQLSSIAASFGGDDSMKQYAAVLICPKLNKARIPDSFARKTGIFRSIRTFFPKVIFNTNTTKDGRFSFVIQPKIGSNTTNTAQVLCVDPSSSGFAGQGWVNPNVKWSNINLYQSTYNGTNLLVDVNKEFMTSRAPFFYEATSGNLSSSVVNIFGFTGTDVPGDLILSAANQGFSPVSTSGNSLFALPPGVFQITVVTRFTSSVASVTAYLTRGAGFSCTVIQENTTTYGGNYVAATTNTLSDPQIVSVSGLYTAAPGANFFVYDLVLSSGTASGIASDIWINAADGLGFDDPGSAYGIVEEIRPVAQSFLATYMGTDLNNGGDIAAAYVPYDLFQSNYLDVSSNQLGQLQSFENVSQLDDSYNGPLKHGAYAWWCPQDQTDYNIASVADHNQMKYPVLLCSGIFQPGVAQPNETNPLRVEVSTVFEYTTRVTAMDTEKCVGSQNMIDIVNNSLRNQPHAMQNKTHFAWIKDFLGRAVTFYNKNEALIKPMISLAAGALL